MNRLLSATHNTVRRREYPGILTTVQKELSFAWFERRKRYLVYCGADFEFENYIFILCVVVLPATAFMYVDLEKNIFQIVCSCLLRSYPVNLEISNKVG